MVVSNIVIFRIYAICSENPENPENKIRKIRKSKLKIRKIRKFAGDKKIMIEFHVRLGAPGALGTCSSSDLQAMVIRLGSPNNLAFEWKYHGIFEISKFRKFQKKSG